MIIDREGNIATDSAIVVVRDTIPTSTETTTTTTTTTTTSTTTNNTQFAQLEEQLYAQLIVISGIGALTIVSLLFNVMVFRKIGKKGKK